MDLILQLYEVKRMYIELKHVNKYFKDFKASDDVSFEIEKGKLVGLLGPSGSGKTTILRILAGLEKEDSGEIWIDGECVNALSASKRKIGFVFQSYALFPYMTVYDNIAYGLKVQKKKKEEIQQRVEELLELVGLRGLEKRYPTQLSGGQRQRVAFARALAPNPQVLLLDEPFAAIDAKVRKELRLWLKDMIRKIGITSIFVTHDQDEAVEVADEIIITNKGKIEQIGTPDEIYRNPKTPFVAQFIGQAQIIDDYSMLKGFCSEKDFQKAIIRPEFVKVYKTTENIAQKEFMTKGVVTDVAFRGNVSEITVHVDNLEIRASHSLDEDNIQIGENVYLMVYRMYVYNENEVYSIQNEVLKTKYERGMEKKNGSNEIRFGLK